MIHAQLAAPSLSRWVEMSGMIEMLIVDTAALPPQ